MLFIKNEWTRRVGLIIVVVTLIAIPCGLIAQNALAQEAQDSPATKEQLHYANALSEAFKQVSKAVAPSVVNIRSTQRLEPASRNDNFQGPDDEMFRRFFDLPDGFQFRGPQVPRERTGEGSGLIVRENGYILTNNHVVDGANELLVTLFDDREYEGTVVGTDPDTDLAVVKIEASGLTAAKLGDSDSLEVGEWVLAIGSPFGLQQTVTAGIVSAKGRQVGIIRDSRNFVGIEDFIQTDAAINPGNSGGPLVNLYGEVVGINTAISTRTGGYMGVGFAIPSKMAEGVMISLLETGRVERGWLGVGIRELTPEFAEERGFEGDGVFINEVFPDSPADKAGIKPGDIVFRIHGRKVSDTAELLKIVAGTRPGEEIDVDIFRFGERVTYSVTLGDRSKDSPTRRVASTSTSSAPGRDIGLTVQELSSELAERIGAGDRNGVIVTKVESGSPADRMGIQRGDLITIIGKQEITNIDDFEEAVEEADFAKGVSMQIFREGTATFLFLRTQN